jgi:RND family efflux transporter MFP subunit
MIVASMPGYVAEANVRAGDLVSEGQVLARLDDKDLRLEQRKWLSEKSQLQKEYREAMAEHDGARVSILQAQLERAAAQLELTEEYLARTNVIAPLSGIVIKGDLSQSLGVPVERGQSLFEVAPLDAYRVMLEVDEREIGVLQPGQTGRLALAGFPGQRLSFVVDRITPVSTTEDGRNFFTVEGRLQETPELLRPGMQGVGKIDTGQRKLVWVWTHGLVDWLRLWTWSRSPWA